MECMGFWGWGELYIAVCGASFNDPHTAIPIIYLFPSLSVPYFRKIRIGIVLESSSKRSRSLETSIS